jgi:hypothetical protein
MEACCFIANFSVEEQLGKGFLVQLPMAEIKTKPTNVKVEDFLNNVEPEQKRLDSYEILKMMQRVTGEKAVMWGPSIVGFGKYHYKYESGHEADMCIAGFSPRSQAIVVYLDAKLQENTELFKKLGKYKSTAVCLYIKKLSDIDVNVLEELIEKSYTATKKKYN